MTNENICAVICNWNKQHDVAKCVESVLKSSLQGINLDVVVVDNASTDQSVPILTETFGTRITLIKNEKNLGGAGGFNTGLRYAMEANRYSAVWLLDNDVVVDPLCAAELMAELRKSGENAIIGSLILRMDAPTTVQELGAFIRRRSVSNKRDFSLEQVPDIPEVVDYVPACSLMVDMDKLKKVGVMDDGYFLYFDDVEWCTRFRKSGYRVLAAPRSRVWHKEGGRNKVSNLPVYYNWRNYLHFFLHYINPEEIDDFCESYIVRAYTALYISRLLGKHNSHRTILWAVLDALRGIRGKAAENRVLPLDEEVFGKYFSTDFTHISILGEHLDFYTQFEKFLERITPGIPVDFYAPPGCNAPMNRVSHRIEVKPLETFCSENVKGQILVFCRHLLSDPNAAEETFRPDLEQRDKQVFYLDQYSNFYGGYHALHQTRQEYAAKLKKAQAVFAPVLETRFKL